MPADRGGIEDDLGPGESSQPRALGIPLVPADERAHASEVRVEGLEAEIAGSEIKLFVIERIVGDVHLAIQPEDLSVGIDHHGGVVIDAARALLKERGDDRDLRLLRYF